MFTTLQAQLTVENIQRQNPKFDKNEIKTQTCI